MIICLLFCSRSFLRDQSQDVTPRLVEGGWFLIFEYSSPFFFVNWNSLYFSNSYIVLTRYVYYYCIWYDFKMLFPHFFVGDRHGMWLLALEFLLIKSVFHFAFLQLLSGYYYYDYVVIGVLRPSWFTKILFWIGLLLSKEVKQLKIKIIYCCSLRLWSQTCHLLELLVPGFFCPVLLCWGKMARAWGMAAYIRDGYGVFH